MKISEAKAVKEFCVNNLASNPDWKEVLKNLELKDEDFEVDSVRFIEDSSINIILQDELSADPYILGCFVAWAISDATGWPIELIQAAQDGDRQDDIGNEMSEEHIAKLAEILVQNDGYGHHFNSYDGSEEELYYNGKLWHVFDNR